MTSCKVLVTFAAKKEGDLYFYIKLPEFFLGVGNLDLEHGWELLGAEYMGRNYEGRSFYITYSLVL